MSDDVLVINADRHMMFVPRRKFQSGHYPGFIMVPEITPDEEARAAELTQTRGKTCSTAQGLSVHWLGILKEIAERLGYNDVTVSSDGGNSTALFFRDPFGHVGGQKKLDQLWDEFFEMGGAVGIAECTRRNAQFIAKSQEEIRQQLQR